MTAVRGRGHKMSFKARSVVFVVCWVTVACAEGRGEDKKSDNGPACTRNVDDYFAKEVWAKVGSVLCVNCHKEGGDAEGSRFILQDPRKMKGHAQDEAMRHNRDAAIQNEEHRVGCLTCFGDNILSVEITPLTTSD